MIYSETGWEGVDWIHLAQCRDKCWDVVETGLDVLFA
jgi:hypothetical protein